MSRVFKVKFFKILEIFFVRAFGARKATGLYLVRSSAKNNRLWACAIDAILKLTQFYGIFETFGPNTVVSIPNFLRSHLWCSRKNYFWWEARQKTTVREPVRLTQSWNWCNFTPMWNFWTKYRCLNPKFLRSHLRCSRNYRKLVLVGSTAKTNRSWAWAIDTSWNERFYSNFETFGSIPLPTFQIFLARAFGAREVSASCFGGKLGKTNYSWACAIGAILKSTQLYVNFETFWPNTVV